MSSKQSCALTAASSSCISCQEQLTRPCELGSSDIHTKQHDQGYHIDLPRDNYYTALSNIASFQQPKPILGTTIAADIISSTRRTMLGSSIQIVVITCSCSSWVSLPEPPVACSPLDWATVPESPAQEFSVAPEPRCRPASEASLL